MIPLEKGKIFKSNACGLFEILEEVISENKEYKSYNTQKFKIRFLKTNTTKIVFWQNIRRGNIIDYNYPTICNIACLGEGEFKSNHFAYLTWKGIIHRCYDIKDSKYKYYGAKGIRICEEWLNFQNFAKWYEENKYVGDLSVDKDILANIQHKEIKIYSPETYILLPKALNCWLLGDNLNTGIEIKNNYYRAQIKNRFGQKFSSKFESWKDAKIWYAKVKYEDFKGYIEEFEIPKYIKEIILKYDFSWYWLF